MMYQGAANTLKRHPKAERAVEQGGFIVERGRKETKLQKMEVCNSQKKLGIENSQDFGSATFGVLGAVLLAPLQEGWRGCRDGLPKMLP